MAEGHETTDVRARPVVMAGGVLLVFAASAAFAMLLFQSALTTGMGPHAGKGPVPMVEPGPDSPAYPIEDWHGVHDEQVKHLQEAAWVNRNAGVVRMPIDRAMTLIVERALLPVREPAPGQVDPAKEPR